LEVHLILSAKPTEVTKKWPKILKHPPLEKVKFLIAQK
jgi:hypothetical protein